jgi:hypothetical protein
VLYSISFPSAGGRTAHGLYYPPRNPDAEAPEGKRPPLLVMSHGGPTSHASAALDIEKQVFTSRGLPLVDVRKRRRPGVRPEVVVIAATMALAVIAGFATGAAFASPGTVNRVDSSPWRQALGSTARRTR